jgi:hypothetical protein
MRASRPALALALAASFVSAGVASAAVKKPVAKPVCNLVTDAAGDAQLIVLPSDDALDVLSGDVASNAKSFTAVIRVKNLAATTPTASGRNYYLQITTPTATNPIYFSYEVDPTGAVANWGELVPGAGGVGSYTSKGKAVATVDKAKNEIHLTVPVADLSASASLKPGAKVSTISVNTTAAFVVLVSDVDTAEAAKGYTAGAKSCVTPGV